MRAVPFRTPGSKLSGAGLLLTSCVLLAACMGPEEALVASNPELRHPIGIQSARAALEIELPPGSDGFSVNQQSDVAAFLATYQRESTGSLRVSVPQGPNEQTRARIATEHLRSLMLETGIAPQAIRVERHATRAGERAALRLSYPRRQAVPPECGDWSEDLGRNPERVHYPNFGCATQRNIALNVANPRDHLQPQPEQPSSSERRSVNWTKYIGATPGSPTPEGAGKSNTKPGAAAARTP